MVLLQGAKYGEGEQVRMATIKKLDDGRAVRASVLATVVRRQYNTAGWVEYQLSTGGTTELHEKGKWFREKDLKAV